MKASHAKPFNSVPSLTWSGAPAPEWDTQMMTGAQILSMANDIPTIVKTLSSLPEDINHLLISILHKILH